jgi:hypothetical protein
MEKRELEDNEPLSQRRDRLRGGYPLARPPSSSANVPAPPPKSPFQLEVPGLTDNPQSGSDDEGETLAQRIRRLKAEKQQKDSSHLRKSRQSISGDFASELMSQFGGDLQEPSIAEPEADIDPDGETLGQRRKRLQREREARGEVDGQQTIRPRMQQRRSVTDLLQTYPAVGGPQAYPPAGGLMTRPGYYPAGYQPQLQHGMYHGSGGMMYAQPPPHMDAYGMPMPMQRPMPYGSNHPMHSYAADPYAMSGMGMQKGMGLGMGVPMQVPMNGYAAPHMGMSMRMPYGQQPGVQEPDLELDPRRRDLIDRWRQSVMP